MDAPDTIQPAQTQPAITDPQMDTNKVYEQEHERPQQVSPDQPIQLAQNDVPTIPTADTHHIVQAPDGAKVAFPKGTPPDTMHQEMTKWWDKTLDSAVNLIGGIVQETPGVAPALEAGQKYYVDPMDKYLGKVGEAAVASTKTGFTPKTEEYLRKQDVNPDPMPEWMKGVNDETIKFAAQTVADPRMWPLFGERLATAAPGVARQVLGRALSGAVAGQMSAGAVEQVQNLDANWDNMSVKERSGAMAGTLMNSIMAGLSGFHAAVGSPVAPITREKTVQPTTTSYEHTPDQSGQFGNYEHVVTTKNAEGKTVGHLAAQDTAPGEVTIRSNQIYDEAHRGQGKGTAAIRTLVNETAKNPELKTIHSDITTTGAARGAWEKIADANPDTVTKQDFNGVPRWSVDLDKVREKAANAPEFNGEERRGATRGPLMSATDIENNLKTGQPVSTPFDSTAGAMDTINRDLEQRLSKPAAKTPQTAGTAEDAARDTAIMARLKKEHPDWSTSRRLQEAAKIANPPKTIEVKHWSKQGMPMTETNPEKFGTGRAGAEKSRANEEGFVPRTYFGMEGYKEPAIQSGLEHKATLDSNAYYDKDADPHGIWKDNFKPSDKASAATNAERAVKEAGYSGYYSPEQQVLASFNKVPVRVSELQDAANAFNKREGRPPIEHKEVGASPYAKRIADAYDKLQHNPNDPEVQKAYGAMKDDIDKQWDFATKNMGVKFEPWDKEGQPYANSKEMVADVKNNHHLNFFRGGEMPADHPLAAVDPETGFTYNDKLRAIHDLFGHAVNGNQFGPAGEERAWQEHRQMFSPEAVPAVTTETRGQNSWVNFGAHLRDAEGNIPGKGEPGAIHPADRPFAEQKAGLLPEWTHTPEGSPEDTKAATGILAHIASGKDYAILTAENPKNVRISDAENAARNAEMEKELRSKGYEPVAVEGHNQDVQGNTEHSVFVPGISPAEAAAIGRKYGQQAVLTTEGLHDVENGTIMKSDNTNILTGDEARKQPYYSTVDGKPFSVSLGDVEDKTASLKDLWHDESGTYTSGQFMKYLAKNKLMSKAGSETLDAAAKKDFVPGWAEVSQFLTPEDRAQASKSVQKNVVDLVNKFNPEWVSDAAKAGSAAKGWYSRATGLIQHMFGEDAHRFTNFVASLSPQKDVEQNFTDALNFYNLWQDAGKPLGPENEKVIRDLTERAETGMSGSVARNQLYENLVNDVQPTGPKVSNFARNLKGNMDAVTKDRWMAYLFGNNERMFRWFKEGSPKPAVHLAADALIRAVGQSINMLPAEVQETSWSFLRTVVNLTEKEKISPKEAIGRVNDTLIREGASELTRLIADSPKVQSALNRLATATGDERFRADNLQNSPRFKQLLQEHQEQPSTGGGAGAINRAGAERGVKQAIKARSEISQAKKAKAAAPPAEKPALKKAPKDKATEFNPEDMSENITPALSERMKDALS